MERRALRMAEIATGSRDEALDLVQEAMLAMVRNYSARPPCEWGPLFQRCLQSRVSDWHRRRSVRRRLHALLSLGTGQGDEEDPFDCLPDPCCPDPLEALDRQQAVARLEQALRRLPLRQQQVFLLRAWEGLDVKGTACALRCSEGSVKTHYARAVERLRAALGEHWP